MAVKQVLNLYKEKGETPLERIERFRIANPEYSKVKMTYAGRLDPMASGVLLVLVGEECKNKEKYLNKDKEYLLDILFGFSTDSLDVLGIVEDFDEKASEKFKSYDLMTLRKMLDGFVGKFNQKYPNYSSKTVNGKPMFEYARGEGIDENEIPEKEVEIYKIDFVGVKFLSAMVLRERFRKDVFLVKGDFRQNNIHAMWERTFDSIGNVDFPIISLKVACSSGTYMRVLSESVGRQMQMPSMALNIVRTAIDKEKLAFSIK